MCHRSQQRSQPGIQLLASREQLDCSPSSLSRGIGGWLSVPGAGPAPGGVQGEGAMEPELSCVSGLRCDTAEAADSLKPCTEHGDALSQLLIWNCRQFLALKERARQAQELWVQQPGLTHSQPVPSSPSTASCPPMDIAKQGLGQAARELRESVPGSRAPSEPPDPLLTARLSLLISHFLPQDRPSRALLTEPLKASPRHHRRLSDVEHECSLLQFMFILSSS